MLPFRLLRQPARHPFLRASIRSHPPPIAPSKRSFHATARRQDATTVLLTLPHALLTGLHSFVPWYAAIPLSAFVFRGLILWGVGRWSRQQTQRYIGTHPLRQAIGIHKQMELIKGGKFESIKVGQKTVRREALLRTKEFDKRWNCSLNTQMFWTSSTLPLYLVMSEIIRRMGDMHQGIMGLLLSGAGLATPDPTVPGTSLGVNPWYEPELATEGMLWFPNLLVPDPSGYLPCIVSAIMFYNIATKGGKLRLTPEGLTPFARRMRYAFLALAASISVIGQSIPAALMMYWVGSSSSALLFNWYLDKKYPAPEGLHRCKRPLRMVFDRKPASPRLGMRRPLIGKRSATRV